MHKFLIVLMSLFCCFTLLAGQNNVFKIEQKSNKSLYQSTLLCNDLLQAGSFQHCQLRLWLDNKPVENTEIFLDGGMPQHQHGLPTSPKINWSEKEKSYVIKGLKFSMPGLWLLNFKVNAEEKSAKDTIEITLKVN